MNEERFLELTKEIINDIINNKPYSQENKDKAREIYNFIYANPDNHYVKEFISSLASLYYSLLYDQNLIRAYNMPEDKHYKKQMEIAKALPFTLHPTYADYIPNIIPIPSYIYGLLYREYFYLLETYIPNSINNPYMNAIKDLVNQTRNISICPYDGYSESLEKELQIYYEAHMRKWTNDTQKYYKENETKGFKDTEDIFRCLENKAKGNIGEYQAYEMTSELDPSCIFVSRDIGNGFGYDIYATEDDIEYLIEVKTTSSLHEEDVFSLSQNEYRVMIESMSYPKAKYIICRVKLDDKLNTSFVFLTPLDNETLVDTNDPDHLYKLNIDENNIIYFQEETPQRR